MRPRQLAQERRLSNRKVKRVGACAGISPIFRWRLSAAANREKLMMRFFDTIGSAIGACLLIISVRVDDWRERSRQRRSKKADESGRP